MLICNIKTNTISTSSCLSNKEMAFCCYYIYIYEFMFYDHSYETLHELLFKYMHHRTLYYGQIFIFMQSMKIENT